MGSIGPSGNGLILIIMNVESYYRSLIDPFKNPLKGNLFYIPRGSIYTICGIRPQKNHPCFGFGDLIPSLGFETILNVESYYRSLIDPFKGNLFYIHGF